MVALCFLLVFAFFCQNIAKKIVDNLPFSVSFSCAMPAPPQVLTLRLVLRCLSLPSWLHLLSLLPFFCLFPPFFLPFCCFLKVETR